MQIRNTTALMVLTIGGLTATSSQAGIIVIDFEAQARQHVTGLSISEDGFDIDVNGVGGIGDPSWFGGFGPDNGTTRYAYSYDSDRSTSDPHISVVQTYASLFSLLSFDAAELHQGRLDIWAKTIEVIGFLGSGGTVVANFDLDWINDSTGGVADFQTFVLPDTFTGLREVQFNGWGPSSSDYYSLDNITLDDSGAAQAVPEPSSFLLLCSGITGLCGYGWRRRRVNNDGTGR